VYKQEHHRQDLIPLLDAFLEIGDAKDLLLYIVSHSNLPGRRGNLELALAFGDLLEDYAGREPQPLWELCGRMAESLPTKPP
jgi:hypothetical protein